MKNIKIVFIVLILIGYSLKSYAKTDVKEYLDYLKTSKNSNVNKSQDRLIKKQAVKKSKISNFKYVDNSDIGVFVKFDFDEIKHNIDVPDNFSGFANYTQGIICSIPWSILEPAEGKFDFNCIENVVKWCREHNKLLILQIPTIGFNHKKFSNSPKWLESSDVECIKYINSKGENCQYINPLDTKYLAKLSNFVFSMSKVFDGNPYIHSIKVLGSGYNISNSIMPPDVKSSKTFIKELVAQHSFTNTNIVNNYKFIIDTYVSAFKDTKLLFALNEPIQNRTGEDILDEITNHLIFKYGAKFYLVRDGIKSTKNSFDDYRLITKYHNDTYTGLEIKSNITVKAFNVISKWALTDGISFIELPVNLLSDLTNKTNISNFKNFRNRLGYQIALTKVSLPESIEYGKDIDFKYTLYNHGVANPFCTELDLEKYVPCSYKIEIQFVDNTDKLVAKSYHTPNPETNKMQFNQFINFKEDLKSTKIPSGDYKLYFLISQKDSDTKLNFLDLLNPQEPIVKNKVYIGHLQIK